MAVLDLILTKKNILAEPSIQRILTKSGNGILMLVLFLPRIDKSAVRHEKRSMVALYPICIFIFGTQRNAVHRIVNRVVALIIIFSHFITIYKLRACEVRGGIRVYDEEPLATELKSIRRSLIECV